MLHLTYRTQSYLSVLRDSSEIAIQGATAIKGEDPVFDSSIANTSLIVCSFSDFTSSVMPFLQKDETEVFLEEKLAELEKYEEVRGHLDMH